MAKKSTWDDLFTIFFRCLLFGKWPSMRHDSSAFLATDSQTKKKSGKDLGIQAALCELRGDWAMFKDTLNLPGWQGKGAYMFQVQLHIGTIGPSFQDCCLEVRLAKIGGHSCLRVTSCK